MEQASLGSGGARRRYSSAKRDQRRADIVAVATRELNAHGVQGLLLADVAAQVGMTKGNLTYYFSRKEVLAAHCIDLTLAEYGEMIAAAHEAPTPRERFLRLFDQFFSRTAQAARGEAPPLAGLGALPALDEPYASLALERYRRLLRSAGALFQASDGPRLDRTSRVTRAQLILTQLFWFSTWVEQFEPGDHVRIARRLFEMLAGGLAVAGTSPTPPPLVPLFPADEPDSDPQRTAFFKAATGLINQLGYRGASIDRISAAVNLTKGSVYHHHASKEDLVLACADRSFAAMWSVMRASEAEAGDGGWRRLSAVIAALIAFQVSDHGPFLRASALSALPPALRERVERQWGQVTHHLAGLVSDAVAHGEVRPVDPTVAAQVIAAALNAADEIHRFAPDSEVDVGTCCAIPVLFGIFADGPPLAARRP